MSTGSACMLDSLAVVDACSIVHACITDAICLIGFLYGQCGWLTVHDFARSGGLFTLATPSKLAAVLAAVDTTVLGFKLDGSSELLTAVGRVAGSLIFSSFGSSFGKWRIQCT